MGETHRHEAQIYQLRAVLRGISPLIWRRLLVRRDSTVAQLLHALQVAFGWDDEHLNCFEIRGREYAVYRDGGGICGGLVFGSGAAWRIVVNGLNEHLIKRKRKKIDAGLD
jgi:hypothetical protein